MRPLFLLHMPLVRHLSVLALPAHNTAIPLLPKKGGG